MGILEDIDELIKEATTENSHFYTAKVLQRARDEIDHLRKCREFESSLQREVIGVGSQYMDVRYGKTYDVTDAWKAIQEELKRK